MSPSCIFRAHHTTWELSTWMSSAITVSLWRRTKTIHLSPSTSVMGTSSRSWTQSSLEHRSKHSTPATLFCLPTRLPWGPSPKMRANTASILIRCPRRGSSTSVWLLTQALWSRALHGNLYPWHAVRFKVPPWYNNSSSWVHKTSPTSHRFPTACVTRVTQGTRVWCPRVRPFPPSPWAPWRWACELLHCLQPSPLSQPHHWPHQVFQEKIHPTMQLQYCIIMRDHFIWYHFVMFKISHSSTDILLCWMNCLWLHRHCKVQCHVLWSKTGHFNARHVVCTVFTPSILCLCFLVWWLHSSHRWDNCSDHRCEMPQRYVP